MENPSALLSYHIGYPGATGLIMIFSFYFVCVPVTGWKDRRPKRTVPAEKGFLFRGDRFYASPPRPQASITCCSISLASILTPAKYSRAKTA